MKKDIIDRYAERVGYSEAQARTFEEGGHRIRHVQRLAEVARDYSIQAEVVESQHCNSGHHIGQKIILDVDGNFITKLGPKKMCVYLISQLAIRGA